GIVAVEALAAGRPVIGTATGGLEELVRNAGGIVVPPGDAAALADAIARYVADDALVSTSAERGKALATSAFTPEVHLADLERTSGRVLGRGARTRAGRRRTAAPGSTAVAVTDRSTTRTSPPLRQRVPERDRRPRDPLAAPDLSICVPTFERPDL